MADTSLPLYLAIAPPAAARSTIDATLDDDPRIGDDDPVDPPNHFTALARRLDGGLIRYGDLLELARSMPGDAIEAFVSDAVKKAPLPDGWTEQALNAHAKKHEPNDLLSKTWAAVSRYGNFSGNRAATKVFAQALEHRLGGSTPDTDLDYLHAVDRRFERLRPLLPDVSSFSATDVRALFDDDGHLLDERLPSAWRALQARIDRDEGSQAGQAYRQMLANRLAAATRDNAVISAPGLPLSEEALAERRFAIPGFFEAPLSSVGLVPTTELLRRNLPATSALNLSLASIGDGAIAQARQAVNAASGRDPFVLNEFDRTLLERMALRTFRVDQRNMYAPGGVVHAAHIEQDKLGGCGWLGALASLTRTPQEISRMFAPDGDGFNFTVHRLDGRSPHHVLINQNDVRDNIDRGGGSIIDNRPDRRGWAWSAMGEAGMAKLHDTDWSDGYSEGYARVHFSRPEVAYERYTGVPPVGYNANDPRTAMRLVTDFAAGRAISLVAYEPVKRPRLPKSHVLAVSDVHVDDDGEVRIQLIDSNQEKPDDESQTQTIELKFKDLQNTRKLSFFVAHPDESTRYQAFIDRLESSEQQVSRDEVIAVAKRVEFRGMQGLGLFAWSQRQLDPLVPEAVVVDRYLKTNTAPEVDRLRRELLVRADVGRSLRDAFDGALWERYAQPRNDTRYYREDADLGDEAGVSDAELDDLVPDMALLSPTRLERLQSVLAPGRQLHPDAPDPWNDPLVPPGWRRLRDEIRQRYGDAACDAYSERVATVLHGAAIEATFMPNDDIADRVLALPLASRRPDEVAQVRRSLEATRKYSAEDLTRFDALVGLRKRLADYPFDPRDLSATVSTSDAARARRGLRQDFLEAMDSVGWNDAEIRRRIVVDARTGDYRVALYNAEGVYRGVAPEEALQYVDVSRDELREGILRLASMLQSAPSDLPARDFWRSVAMVAYAKQQELYSGTDAVAAGVRRLSAGDGFSEVAPLLVALTGAVPASVFLDDPKAVNELMNATRQHRPLLLENHEDVRLSGRDLTAGHRAIRSVSQGANGELYLQLHTPIATEPGAAADPAVRLDAFEHSGVRVLIGATLDHATLRPPLVWPEKRKH